MKPFKDVEAARRQYHAEGAVNSVHRSSLMVPELSGAVAEISFLNHFLIKRGYAHVACRITAVDAQGERIEARLVPVTEPRVHTLRLTDMFEHRAASYIVEFFAAENLFIPFPAVMLNHRGPRCLNTVHAYNRILNDVFEDDTINAVRQCEASIDVCLSQDVDTFIVFMAGPERCRGALEVEFATERGTHRAMEKLDVPRFCHHEIRLSRLLDGLPDAATGVLKVRQPPQAMFFGRLLAGLRTNDGAFSANHSYYDSSATEEYWDDGRASYRLYPFFAGLENVVRMYPIMSPSRLAVTVELIGADGGRLGAVAAGELTSPGTRFLALSVNDAAAEAGIDPADIGAVAVLATSVEGSMPTRVNHQLIHSAGGLPASVNVSLANPNVFQPEGKTGLTWGQVPVGGGVESWLGVAGHAPGGPACDLDVTFYDTSGEIAKRRWTLPAGGAFSCKLAEELAAELGEPSPEEPSYIWYVIRGARADVTGYVVTRHGASGHCSGEHSF